MQIIFENRDGSSVSEVCSKHGVILISKSSDGFIDLRTDTKIYHLSELLANTSLVSISISVKD